ncbi:MAG: hypothetical protein Q4F67_03370 [Propionibacteriaceae bacterium]|nr:hypothetical protein [Propionibacteriaceae bacterium]
MSTSVLEELASRVRAMEGRTPDARAVLPVLPALKPLLPRGLQGGSCYVVGGSLGVATALLAEASAAGEWSAVVGVPEFGAEAAAAQGVDLARTLLVPDPRDEWLTVVATLVDVLPIVLARPPGRLAPKEITRLEARVRDQSCVFVVLQDGPVRWPRAAAALEVGPSQWSGLAAGRGVLAERRLPVRLTERSGRAREIVLHQRAGSFVCAAESAPRLRAVG